MYVFACLLLHSDFSLSLSFTPMSLSHPIGINALGDAEPLPLLFHNNIDIVNGEERRWTRKKAEKQIKKLEQLC